MKDKFSKLIKGAGELKDTATKLTQDAVKNAGVVKGVVKTGVDTSKSVLKKAKDSINKETISQGIDVATKGVDLAAKGAKIASKGYDALSNTMEKTAQGMKKIGDKFKDKK